MVKFPSQNKMMYVQDTSISNDAWSVASSGSAAGPLNIPKDLSLLNRRGFASTTRKGVPLVYRCKVDLFATGFDGTGSSAAVGSDFVTTLRANGCQNNWVIRNAAVKWHAAREKMFRDGKVSKKSRGAYSHEIRYGYDAYNQTWMKPIDGDGNMFTGGTWDLSELSYAADPSFYLTLIGDGQDEESGDVTVNSLSIGHSYLVSRINQQADTNLETEEGPAKFSVLNQLLEGEQVATSSDDNIVEEGRNAQDNPPYEVLDLSSSGDVQHDITEPVELGRCLVGPGAQSSSMIIDVPFGLTEMFLTHYDAADTATNHIVKWDVEVLDIYEMQG